MFVIVMEALHKLLIVIVHKGLPSGFFVGSRNFEVVNISHLLFANDILVFCGNNPDHLRYLRVLFLSFEIVSSLKINLAKSILVPMGCVDNVDGLASILGYGVSSLPLEYLGLLFRVSFKIKYIWDGIVGKIERLLASWKRMYLSKGGRVTFIKRTISNIPTYFLSLFPITACVANRIEKLH
jgi:hypothetical protein